VAAIPNLELDGASRKLRTLVVANLSYESTNLMSGEPLCNFREAYIWNCWQCGISFDLVCLICYTWLNFGALLMDARHLSLLHPYKAETKVVMALIIFAERTLTGGLVGD
jgi:hypothetical protein